MFPQQEHLASSGGARVSFRDCAANGVFGPTRRAVVRWDGHCE
jgi:hypothetical protein